MFRNALIASLITLGAVGGAQAQDPGPRLLGGGENAQVVYGEPSRNVAGGGVASLSGGGDNAQIAYGPDATTGASNGLVARLENINGDLRVVYGPAAPSGSMLAGRAGQQPRG
jgi:hypothetical protein